MQNIDPIVEKIINNPLFLRLKDVIENNGYHDHEKTYDHLIKTFETAKEQVKGDFITNPDAKKLFLEFVNTPLEELTNGDIMVLTALLHDVGKILSYKDGDSEQTLRHENTDGIVSNPGHEYWGSTIISYFLKDTVISVKIVEKIAAVIRMHDTFGAQYLTPKLGLPIDEIIDDVKARAEGLYKEAMFNQYCDCFTAMPFEACKAKIVEIFSEPSLYLKREYFIK